MEKKSTSNSKDLKKNTKANQPNSLDEAKAKKTKKEVKDTSNKKTEAANNFYRAIGEITLLLSRSPMYGFLFLRDLEWMIFPAVANNQYLMFFNNEKQMIALVTWASVNEAVDQRLSKKEGRIRPHEWRSGTKLWLIEIISPMGNPKIILEKLKVTVFKNKSFKYLSTDPTTNKMEVVTFDGEGPKSDG